MRGVEDYGRNLSCTDNSLKSSEGLRNASFDRGMRVHLYILILVPCYLLLRPYQSGVV